MLNKRCLVEIIDRKVKLTFESSIDYDVIEDLYEDDIVILIKDLQNVLSTVSIHKNELSFLIEKNKDRMKARQEKINFMKSLKNCNNEKI